MDARPHDDEDPHVGEPSDAGDENDDAEGAPRGGEPAQAGPSGPDDVPDLEARWQEIVAELGGQESLRPGEPIGGAPADQPSGPRTWAPDPAAEEAEDHYEPPEPDRILGGDPLLTMAWTAVVGAAVLLLLAAVVWRTMPSLLVRGAGVAFLAGVGLLLWRMPHHRDDDDGPGAVV